MKNIIARIVPISLAVVMLLALMSGCGTTQKGLVETETPVKEVEEEALMGEINESVIKVCEYAGELKRLTGEMSKPAGTFPVRSEKKYSVGYNELKALSALSLRIQSSLKNL